MSQLLLEPVTQLQEVGAAQQPVGCRIRVSRREQGVSVALYTPMADIEGGGGMRKIRMRRRGSGKRGGARVYMLVACAKPAKVDLSPTEVATLRELIKAL